MKNENHRALFDAVTDLDADLIEEAAEPRTIRFPKRIRRIAAIAAVIAILMTALLWPSEENYITGPGVLVVRAYELDEPMLSEENSAILEEGIVLPLQYNWTPAINIVNGLPLKLSIPDDTYANMRISFDIRLSGGSFQLQGSPFVSSRYEYMRKAYLGDKFTIENDTRIYWVPWSYTANHAKKEYTFNEMCNDSRVFVDIIIYADAHIIGYAVVEIFDVYAGTSSSGFMYSAKILKLISFPEVHGTFQPVSEEYVTKQMELSHQDISE